MHNKFTLPRKSRFKKDWLDDQAMKMAKFCIFLQNFLFLEFEKIVLWLNDRANPNPKKKIPA